jgi:phospholipase/lecithinase/hemolysin
MPVQFWNSFSAASANSAQSRRQTNARLFRLRTLLSFAALALLSCGVALAEIHDYSTIVVFGDSLSDTGNVSHLTESLYYPIRIPGPIANYTDGRFTDGFDTVPPAQNYFGVWIEQFAAALPSHPEIKDSLDGGTDYAYGFATTGSGTSVLAFGPSNLYPVQIEDIGQQITDYLATHPHIDDHTLFVVWGGAIDLLDSNSPNDVLNAAARQIGNIQRLIRAGATQFLVPNLPPLGLVPRLNGSLATSVPATAASLLFNSYLDAGISLLKDYYLFRHLTFYKLDVFNLLLHVVASPGSYSLADVQHAADVVLPPDPDTFLFWDDLHPTTRGHNILATAAIELLSH